MRQLEELVAGRSLGDLPDSPANDSARRHVLRFEVTGETLALFRQATVALRRCSGAILSDDDVLLEMARQVLGGPKDEGRSSYQIAVTVCAECGRASQDAGHETVAIGAEVLEMACCDAQHLGRVDGVRAKGAQPQAEGRAEDAMRGNDARVAHVDRCVEHDASSADVRAVHVDRALERTASSEHRAGGAHVGRAPEAPALESHPPGGHAAARAAANTRSKAAALGFSRKRRLPKPQRRATQTIPPAVRRAVLRRDRGRCQVPGCGNCIFLDVHHIVLRSEGGRHDAGNLITLCGAHHRAVHDGELTVEHEGTAVCFRWADGSVYGGVANPTILDTLRKVSSALRHMGFREGEVRHAIAELLERAELERTSLQDCLRAALARLTPALR